MIAGPIFSACLSCNPAGGWRVSFTMRQAAQNKSPSVVMAAVDPRAEIAKLSFLLGTWREIDIYEKSQFAPHGGTGTGVYKTVWGPGGFSLLTDFEYEGPQGKSTGHQVLTWHPSEECYAGCGVTSAFPGCIMITGNWEGLKLVLFGEFEAAGRRVGFRQVFSDIEDRTMLVRQYNSIDGGPLQLYGTSKLTRY